MWVDLKVIWLTGIHHPLDILMDNKKFMGKTFEEPVEQHFVKERHLNDLFLTQDTDQDMN